MTNFVSSGAFDEIAADERDDGLKIEVKGIPGTQTDLQTALLIAQMTTVGVAVPATAITVAGDGSAAAALFGRGSNAHRMVMAFRRGNSTTPLAVIGLPDNAAGTAAALTLTFSGTAVGAGILHLYIGLDRVQIGVAVGDQATDLASAAAAAINAAADLMVSASSAGAVVTVICRHKGEIGNEIKIHLNLLGELGGEILPAGIAVAGVGFMVGGAGNPDLAPARAALSGREPYYLCWPWTDTASLDAMAAELTDMWGPDRELFGRIGITARRGSLSQLQTFGTARNDKLISCVGIYAAPGPAFETAARLVAKASRSLANHPVRPLHTLELTGERAGAVEDDFNGRDRKDLLWSGVSTLKRGPAETMVIGRMITLYQRNAAGDRDDTWLDVTTPATAGRIVNEIKAVIDNEYIARRVILVDDDTADIVDRALPCTSPKKIKARLIGHYDTLRRAGLAENAEAFERLLQVGRDSANPTRINLIYTPDLANPLITFAAQIAFSIQWPADLVQAA